jgi:hypothetical protein
MKFDIQIPLNSTQFERLKPSENLKADLATVLPKTKYERIRLYLNDPAYLVCVVRPFRGNAAYLLLRMKRPIQIIPVTPTFHRIIQKGARMQGLTVNQFTNVAIRHQIDKLEGKK